jgi:hypothetical protein
MQSQWGKSSISRHRAKKDNTGSAFCPLLGRKEIICMRQALMLRVHSSMSLWPLERMSAHRNVYGSNPKEAVLQDLYHLNTG